MTCPICGTEMVYSTVESTLQQNVYRCPKCQTRKQRSSAARWCVRIGLLIISTVAGMPVDVPDAF
jgi:transposase-like protein